ncbi:glutamate decarboxylase [Adlercreutzia sp. ZJ473]|uniref:glutamate decarboxylase n=1 Tax=Adlercreutzia sp. ZJ473 TaxID=2722822 RepID=UPI001554E337|nr:glutamate decarboxylase [Adlercreutzia sp. ZJ473]
MPSTAHTALVDLNARTGLASPIFGSVAADVEMPTTRLAADPVDPRVASEMIREYLSTEGNAHQNLATFVQTYMEPEAARLMAETLEKNAIDKDEYPMTADLENRCVAIIEDLWHANPDEHPMGTSTVGSSEACMLGGLGMLFRWKRLARAAGVDVCGEVRPNLVISAGYQVCWEKFCRYWDVEMRTVPLDEGHLSLDAQAALKLVDDRTIGVVAILGITYTGRYDDVAALDEALGRYNEGARVPVRIHVDGASGAMVAPFVEPDLEWDFRLPNVWSISTSGHKYGLVYPGIGWVVWRSREALPEDLVFWVSYLGGEEATMAINFSRSAAQIVGQYYVFMRNGFAGYKEVHERTLDVARHLAQAIETMGVFELYEAANEVPIVCWTLKEGAQRSWTLHDLDERLRIHGWQVPAYPLPANLEHVTVQRIVARADLSMTLADKLIRDMQAEIAHLDMVTGKEEPAAGVGADGGVGASAAASVGTDGGAPDPARRKAAFDHSGR